MLSRAQKKFQCKVIGTRTEGFPIAKPDIFTAGLFPGLES